MFYAIVCLSITTDEHRVNEVQTIGTLPDDMIEISVEDFDKIATELADLRLATILPENRAYFHYMTDDKARAVFKKKYMAMLRDRYIIVSAAVRVDMPA